jgi:sugar/nucleoside kinase (ribokinase family)
LELPKSYIKGSVGAGDAFCAGALYSIYNDYDDEKMLKFASNTAACNLSEADSISGMKNSEFIINMDNNYKRRIL